MNTQTMPLGSIKGIKGDRRVRRSPSGEEERQGNVRGDAHDQQLLRLDKEVSGQIHRNEDGMAAELPKLVRLPFQGQGSVGKVACKRKNRSPSSAFGGRFQAFIVAFPSVISCAGRKTF